MNLKKLFKFVWIIWTVNFLLLMLMGLVAVPKKISRKYWPHTIAEITADNPAAWSKIHTHMHAEGYVTYTTIENDGDIHIRVCDSAGVATMDRKRCIVAECIPSLPCAKPKLGTHVAVEGIYRFDAEGGCSPGAQHCWHEVHPVEKLTVLK